jgi:hypothetical protein
MCLITRVRGIQGVTPLIPAISRYIDVPVEILSGDCHHGTFRAQMSEAFRLWLL